MSKIVKIATILLFVLGIIFLSLPLIFIWLISNYERYVWLINGPYPFSHLGGGPFQLRVMALLGLLGVISVTISILLRKNKGVIDMKTITLISLIAAFFLGIIGLFVTLKPLQSAVVSSFEECASAGYPVMESYPRQCATPDGRLFVETVPPHSFVPEQPSGNSDVICTMEVKQCPDGTYVGRVPPDCEFAPCPVEKAQ
jgi:hypothetical protein